MKKSALLFSLCFFLSACATFSGPHYDLLIDVTPMSVKKTEGVVMADAIAGTPEHPEQPKALVVFHVNRVIFGEFVKKRGGPGRLDQIGSSLKNKDLLGALNYKDPNELVPQDWMIVAVEDPGARFGLDYGGAEVNRRFRLYLSKVKGREGSYILVKSKPVS